MALQYFINNLSKEILYECKKIDIECHHNFTQYYLNLLSLDPIWNLYPEMNDINRLDALRLIRFVVTKMKHQQCPCIVCLKIQFYFNCNFEERTSIVNQERNNFKVRLRPLQEEIVETMTEDGEEIALLKKKLIYYITLWRGLGNPTKIAVYREAQQALNSIYEESDLKEYMYKTQDDKEQELFQLAQICAGIRIFNWSCKKGGEGIEDLPVLVKEGSKSIMDELQQSLVSTMENVNLLTTAVDSLFKIEPNETNKAEDSISSPKYFMVCLLPHDTSYEDVEFMKDLLIVMRQVEVLCRKLIAEIEVIEKDRAEMDVRFQETLNHFHSLVYLKVGIPTAVIFPIFIELDEIWMSYQDALIHLTKLSQIHSNLQQYIKHLLQNMEIYTNIVQDKEIFTDADRLAMYEKLDDNDAESLATTTSIQLVQMNDEAKLEFLGFCPWKLIQTQGGLLPGIPNLGVYVFNERNYVLSCPEAVAEFLSEPNNIVNEALELARKKTELIALLQLEDLLSEVQMIKELITEQKPTEEKLAQEDRQTQTEVIPAFPEAKRKYQWNVWELKRQAMTMATLEMTSTVACQTESSASKTVISTQTQEIKETATQTMRDNYTNVPRKLNYFFGLRGRKDDKQCIVDLTCPVDENGADCEK